MAPDPTSLYGDIERLLIGMVITSWPMDRNAYEKGWNEAIHAAREKIRIAAPAEPRPAPAGLDVERPHRASDDHGDICSRMAIPECAAAIAAACAEDAS
jgi:hypothetical protein